MAKQTIGIGTTANDGTGDPIRTGGDKINDNFTDLYNRTDGNSPHQVITARVNWSNLSAEFQEQDLIWAAVNADLTHIVKHDHDLQFRTVRKVYGQVGSIKTYDVYETYWHLRDKLTVVNGNNVSLGSGNTQLDSTNGFLVFTGRKVTNVIGGVVQEGGFTRDFGVTGATPIEDSVNAGAIAYPSKGLYLFNGNDGTDDYLYMYEGDASEIGTGSGVTTSASDFSILTKESADPAPKNSSKIKLLDLNYDPLYVESIRFKNAGVVDAGSGAINIETVPLSTKVVAGSILINDSNNGFIERAFVKETLAATTGTSGTLDQLPVLGGTILGNDTELATIDIYKNGLLLEGGVDFTISGVNLTFTDSLLIGDKIIAKYLTSISV